MIFAVDIGWGWSLTIKSLVVLGLVPMTALMFGYIFMHKMMSHMQSRLGPMDAGGFHGWFQLMGDGIKFMQKEDLVPENSDKKVFKLAPFLIIISTFLVFLIIPAGPDLIVKDLNMGIFYALAVSSLSVIGVLMAGWASASKFSLIGALRASAQLIAYELPLLLSVVGVVAQAGTLSMQGIVKFQHDGSIFGFDGVGLPLIIPQFLGFIIFMIGVQAELNQPPFDMPVAESELVSGYMAEYSGFRFLFFFLGEVASTFAFSAIAATLYLGGWSIPFVSLDSNLMLFLGPISLLVKTFIVGFFIFWIRFTYPRMREDQLQKFAWKYLIPLALINVLVTGFFQVVV